MTRGMKVLVGVGAIAVVTIAAVGAGVAERVSAAAPSATAANERAASELAAVARGIIDVEGGIVQLAASRDGVVQAVLVEEGETVRAGQPLASLDDRAPRLALAVAVAELSQAEAAIATLEVRETAAVREYDRLLPLAHSEAVSRKALDQAGDALRLARSELAAQRAAVETARARKAAAEHEVAERTVRAPSDGVIVRRLARAGDGVSTLNVTTLFWLAPATQPIVRAEIEESFADRVHSGMSAEVVSESDESRVRTARVVRVGRAFGPRRVTVHDPRDRADVRVLEVILALDGASGDTPLGQRVIVRFGGQSAQESSHTGLSER